MSRVELNRIVTKDDKGVSEATGSLAILYRLILFDLGIDAAALMFYLDQWIKDPANPNPKEKTNKKVTQARGNYIKKMIEPAMTWKSFADFIMMLRPRYIRLTVELGWEGTNADGSPRETKHTVRMNTDHISSSTGCQSPSYHPDRANETTIDNYDPSFEMDDDDDDFDNSSQMELFDDD